MMTKTTTYSILGLLALLLITVVSTCSPLYPTNPYCDANIYLTIGRGMLDGLMPYRDLYDQKGPLLYILHALSAGLTGGGFLGIYFLEIVCCFVNLVLILKTLRLWMDERAALPVAIAIGALTYCSICMCFGDTVEELSLPILTGSMYLFYRYAKWGDIPSRTKSILLGVGIGVIFWMKFTVVATYAGAGLATLLIAYRRHQARDIWALIGWAVVGFAIVTAPILLYFAYEHAVVDLLQGYLFFNIFHYNTGSEGMHREVLWRGYLVIYFVILALLALIPENKAMRLMIVLSAGATALLFVTVFCFYYYYEVLFIFLPLLGIAFKRLKESTWLWVVSIVFALVVTFTDYNFRLLLEDRATCFAAPMAEVIQAEGEDNPAILTYNMLNSAIFVQANAHPRIQYFFTPNSVYPEIMKQQNDYLRSGQAQWVVTPDILPDSLGYECVMTTIEYDRGVGIDMFMHRETCVPTHLYKKKL